MPLDPRKFERPPPSIMTVIVLLNCGVVVSLAQMITEPLELANIIIAVLVTAGLFMLARGVRSTHRAAWWATCLAGGFGILVAM